MTRDEVLTTLTAAGLRAGLQLTAVADYLRRGLETFAGDDAPAADVETWIKSTKADAPHLFSAPPVQRQASPIAPEHQSLSAAERLSRYRPATPAKSRRPEPFTASAEQAASLAKLTPTARLTAVRAMQRAATDG